MKNIEEFAYAANIIIIKEILKLDIMIPRLIFDYSSNPNINNGYYMYQNIAGTTITLNMSSINTLKQEDDIKTVIVYGFIHEIMHMYQRILSDYKSNSSYYLSIEDNADYATIEFIRKNISLINKKLQFNFNDIFLIGIERQLKSKIESIPLNLHSYIAKTLAGTLCTKLNYNFDYLYNLMMYANTITIIFPDKTKYYVDLDYEQGDSISILINILNLTDYGMIHINLIDQVEEYKVKELILSLY